MVVEFCQNHWGSAFLQTEKRVLYDLLIPQKTFLENISGKPATGDHTNAVGYAVLLMSALVLMILILVKNRRKA